MHHGRTAAGVRRVSESGLPESGLPESGLSETGLVRRRTPRARRGFTLIEVLIVLAIVLALSALVGIAIFGRQDEAKGKLAEIDLNSLKSALRGFRLDFDRFPTDEEGLAVLWSNETLDAEVPEGTWRKYLESPMATDRWGNAWNYRAESENGEDYDLWSNGPDGEEGTEDDIVSWTAAEGAEAGDSGVAPPPPAAP